MLARTALCLIVLSWWTAPAVAQPRAFTADAGMLFHPILADRTADFEAVITRVRDAMRASENAARQRQAQSWKVFQMLEPGPDGSVLYVFVMDPALKATDYDIATILREELPQQAQQLYETFVACYARDPSLVNLRLVTSFAAPAPGQP